MNGKDDKQFQETSTSTGGNSDGKMKKYMIKGKIGFLKNK